MSVLTEARPVTQVALILNPTISIVDVDMENMTVDLVVKGAGIHWDPVNQTITLRPPAGTLGPVSYDIPITIDPTLPDLRFYDPAALLEITGNTEAGVLYSPAPGGIEISLALFDALQEGEAPLSLSLAFQFTHVGTGVTARIDPTLILKPPSGP